jgi:tetratricopeptide (TPR) repeat protein
MGKKALLIELFFRSLCPPFFSFSRIEAICRDKLSKKPKDINVLWILSNLYIYNKKYDEARHYLEKLSEINKNTKSVKLLLSKVYYNLKNYNKVKEILENGEVLSLEDSEHYYLGDSLVELKEFNSAAEHLSIYLRFHKEKYVPFVRIGYSYYMQGLFDNALEAYRKAAELNPNSIEIEESIVLCANKIRNGKAFH